ncbi:hypothetical protein GY45DRAFT_1010860 [Cubamyces sp. BRFM 1775]|nr:hypothetical protein GY45DRAFT_1010860 [Cubamyces sp. BRFM 1775]
MSSPVEAMHSCCSTHIHLARSFPLLAIYPPSLPENLGPHSSAPNAPRLLPPASPRACRESLRMSKRSYTLCALVPAPLCLFSCGFSLAARQNYRQSLATSSCSVYCSTFLLPIALRCLNTLRHLCGEPICES